MANKINIYNSSAIYDSMVKDGFLKADKLSKEKFLNALEYNPKYMPRVRAYAQRVYGMSPEDFDNLVYTTDYTQDVSQLPPSGSPDYAPSMPWDNTPAQFSLPYKTKPGSDNNLPGLPAHDNTSQPNFMRDLSPENVTRSALANAKPQPMQYLPKEEWDKEIRKKEAIQQGLQEIAAHSTRSTTDYSQPISVKSVTHPSDLTLGEWYNSFASDTYSIQKEAGRIYQMWQVGAIDEDEARSRFHQLYVSPQTAQSRSFVRTIDERRNFRRNNAAIDAAEAEITSKLQAAAAQKPTQPIPMPYMGDARISDSIDEQYYKQSLRFLDDARKISRAYADNNYNGTSTAQRVLRGIGDNLITPEAITMGFSAIADNANLMRILEKDERGEQLSDAEETLLSAAIIKQYTEAAYASGTGIAYNIGAVTGESLPYMLSFVATGIPIKAATSGLSKRIVNFVGRQLQRKGIGRAATRATKTTLGLGGNIATSALQAPIMPSTYSDYLDRRIGTIDSTTDGMGNISFSHQGDSRSEAALKAYFNTFYQNFGERSGEAISSLWGMFGRGIGKIPIGRGKSINDIFDTIHNSRLGKFWDTMQGTAVADFMRQANYDGVFAEVVEEYISGILNAATIGDQSFEELFSQDNLLTTMGGIALTSVMLGSANATLGVAATQRIRTNFNRSSKAAQQYFSPEQLNQLIGISGGSVQDITTFLAANIARRQLLARQISQLAARQRNGETGIEAQINTLGAELQDLRMQYDFVNASAMYNAYIGGLSRRIEPMREQARAAIRANGDPATGLTIQVDINGRQGYLIGGNYNHIQDSDGNISVTPTGDLATVLFDGDKTPTPNIPMETISILGVRRTDDVIRDGDRAIFAATEQEENAAQAPATGSTVTVSGSQGNFILQGYDPQGNAIVTPLNTDGTPAAKNGNPITASVPSENIIPEEADNTSSSIRTGSIAYIDGIPYSVDQVDGENAIIHQLNTDGTPVNDEQGNPVTSIVPTATLSSSPHPAQTVEPQNVPDEQQPSTEQPATEQDAAIEETNTQQQPAIVDDNITETPSSALSRIPKDKNGKPIYEQSDPETAYDAILQQADGDTALASRVILSMIDNKEAALKKLSKAKPRRADNPADIINAEKELAAQIKQAESDLQFWKDTALVPSLRNQAQKEAEANSVIQDPSLADTPDITDDSPSDARKRGFRRYAGSRIDRSEPLHPATQGNTAEIRFSAKQVIPVHAAVIEADEIIPSHINGQRNPKHFLDEAQPKERTDQASVMAARQIAADLRPEEITSLTTAYSGAPVINARGEVIQGNNRSAALREMWSSYPEQAARYRQYLIDHAAQLGIDPASIQNMKAPVLVAIADVSDQEAIRLGQYTQTDLESGGTERIKPQNAITAMGNNVKNFANILLQSTDENASLSELLDRNALAALKWMQAKGYITPTQYQSAVDARGNISAEAKNDLRNILFAMAFKGAAPQLQSMFDNLPARAQRAILTTAYRDTESPEGESLIPELQNSIRAFHYLMQYPAFAAATNYKDARSAIEAWKRQFAIDDVTGDSFLPAEKFSNFALILAASYKGCPQSLIQNIFTGIYDIIQGSRQPNLFDTLDNTPKSLQEAINTTIQELLPQEHNFNYNGTTRSNLLAGNSATSQQPRQGSDGTSTTGERAEDGNGESNRGTGTDRDSETSSSANGDVGLRDSDRSGTERPADEGQGGLPQSKGIRLSAEEVASLLSQMEDNATAAPHVELSEETWSREFPDGNVSTPMGVVKFGENQLAKLFLKKRQDEFGMLKPTLENPDVVINEPSHAKNGAQGERKSSYLFVKTFIYGGKKVKYYTSVTVLKDGMEVVISNHISGRNAIEKKMQENEILHLNEKYSPNSSDRHLAEHSKSVPDLLPTQGEYMSSPEGNTSSISHADDAAPAISLQSRDDVISSDSKDTVNSKDTQDLGEKITNAEAQTETKPSQAQKEAGNYRKGHVQIGQFNVSIENPKGSVRSGVDVTGREWTHTMQNTYGYIRGTEGVDGDHIDVFLANDIDGWNGSRVFVIDQYNEDGTFDEHKVMIGFNDEADAYAAYLANYESGCADRRKIVCSSVNMEDFEKWIDSSHRKTKPFAEYKGVNGEQKSVIPADRIKEINARLSELKERAAEARRSNDIISEARIITESNNLNAELRSLEAETKQRSISKRNLERSKLPLTEKEYANKRSEEIRKSNPDIDEIDAYNQAIDEYPSYILDKIRNGELEKIYEQASINDRIKLGRMVESAGYSVSDISSLANKKRQDEKNQNVHNIGERVTIRFYDGTIIKGDIISTGNGSVTVLNEEDKRKYTVPESRILSHQTNKEEIPNSNTPTKQARNLPGMLKEAYRQGNASDIAKSEADLRAYIEIQSDLKGVAVTYFRSEDNMRQYKDKNSPEYRMNKFIADACKNALLKAGIAKEALMGERKRVAFASTTDDARTLDVMSIDPSYDVLRAVIRNPHTSDSVLRDFTESFKNNGLDYEAQQVLDERRNKKENSVRDNTADADATVTNKQDNNAASKQTKEKGEDPKEHIPKAEKIEDVGEKIGGARKDIIHELTEKARKADSDKSSILDSIRSMPVSKIFNFDYERLRKDGVSNELITLLQVIREIIPSKPRSEYKLRRWTEQVFELYYASLKLITLHDAEQRAFFDKILGINQIDKIYQARMALGGFDSGLNTGKATLEELGETAGHYDKEGNWVSLKGHWYVKNAGKNGGIFPSRKEAEDALRTFAGENASPENSEKKTQFSVYRRNVDGTAFITVKGKPSIIVADGFKNSKEALDYLKTNYADLDAKYRSMKEKTNIAFRENRPRKGRDWRNGKNISAEEFRETFGFRGVEFGNWTNQEDRQQALNNAFDAFMDLADAIGKSPRSLSLNGQLGIAFGARGGGRAAAHYEPDKVVINLTKTQGAGSLAHEWWHAIDNYFARRRGQQHVYNSDRTGYKYNTEKKGAYSENERQELTDAFKELMNAINNSSYGKRSKTYASMKSSYWSRPTELGARAFAIWIERKLSERGTVNDFLANNPTSTDWGNPDMVTKYYPYPIEGDFDTLDTAFDNLFNAIQEEVDATTGNTILFREIPDQSTTQEQTNDRFNNELQQQIDGTLPKGHIYDLGMPSDTLLNAGLPNLPIEMAASRLSDKSMQENHPFDLSEIRNLPKAIQSPMAIFRSATRLGSFVVMTEIEHHGRNFVVAIQANRRKGRIEVNSIRSVYPKNNNQIANWVTEGLLEYADKKRMVEWLSKQRSNSADVRKLFNHATNIIQNFDNPKNNNENIRLREMAAEVADAARPAQVTRQIERLAREMNLPIEIIHSIDDIPDEYTRRYIQGEIDGQPHTIVGYYDRTTGKAYIILPAILQTADPLAEAERTILHEVIAHHGMQALMGRDAYDTLCDEVWQSLPYETRARFAAYVLRKNPRDLTITDIARVAASPALRRAAADEYIAALAEGGVENPTLWQRIKAFFRSILRRMHLYSINPTDADIRYLLSQARENLAQTSTESVHRGTDIRLSEKNLSNEEQEIIDRANADGTYLKAPNGEETNLTPRQWVQVRTQAFKQWFGDWEKAARIEKLRHSKPVIVKYNEEYQLNRDSAKQWLKDNIRGEYVNKDTGEKIIISKIGINEVTSHGTQNESHLKSLSAIPQMIENSVFIDELPNTKEHDKYDSYRYYVVGMKIDNVDYTAKIVVGVKGDSKYYDHRLTQIEKGTLIDNLNGLSNSVAENQNAHDSISKDSKLLSILQTNASKVVDTNGEPLVVYHGSNYRPLLTSGILLPHEGAMGNAVYFSSAFPEAADYAREKLDDFELSEDEVYDGGYITEAFANVRNEDDISHSKYGIGEIIVAVRNSNQIKSATSNTGAFSSENPDIRFRELSVPEETIDNASRQGNDYARDARTHAAASIDTHSPDLSPVEQAEAVRFRELLTRDFSAASDFLNSANLINAAMQANDGKAAWLKNIQEAVFDSMLRLRLLLDRMKKDGASIPAGFNPYLAENQSRSRAQNRIAAFNEDYRRPLIESLAKCINKLREENIGVEIKDNNAAHEALSLYAQARAAVERQEVKEREAREQAKADGTEYKHREWAGLPGIQYAIIALYKGEITDDVEANKNNLQWLQDFATENNIPTVEQYITMVEDALQKENIDNLWENIRRISEFQLTTSRDAGILSRGSYQLLTYGYNIDNIIETLYKEQRKKITDDINNGIGDKDSLAADLADLDRRHLEAVATATDLDAPDAITTLVAGGWITQDIANDIHRYYNYYLPLKGHAEITGEDLFDYNTPSMPRNASRIKSVRGHEQLARDPFNQILRDAEGCIMQAERNRWKQQLYHVLSTNRSLANGQYAIQRKYYQVIKLDDGTVRYEPYQRVVTTENNEDITTFVPTAEEIAAGTAVLLNSSAKFDIYVSQKQRSEHETIVYIDGSPISILFYDARIAKAVNGTNEAYPPQWMPRAIIKASRTIPALLTSWHPEFVLLSNPIRDTQEAIANAAIDKGFKYTALLVRNLATVDRDLWAYTGGKLKQKKDNGQPLSHFEKYVVEFFENGGSVNVTQLSDYETTTKDLKKELKRALKGGTKPSKNFWKRLTEQTELRSRIATYITSRQTGSTIQDAINDAKEITVNFDRRGAQFRNFNLLQMFFNAQMQSVRRQTELMRRHPVRYATTVAILASSKVLIGLGISLLLGGGDDDNTTAEDIIRRYFEINKQLRTRNHIFIIDGEVYRIPVAPAFIPFTTLCEEAAQLAFDPSSHHRNTASQALLSVTSSVLETYVPTLISDPANIMMNVNNAQAWRQSFASGIPMSGRALWQPFIEAIYNYDYTGNPIYTEPQFGAQHLPFHRDYRERTGKAYVYTSKLLSDLTGGNNIIPGKINIHPEQIEHVVQGLAGGIGTLAGRFTGIYKRVQGESAESTGLEFLYDIPFAARLYGGNMQQRENRYYQSLFFDDKQALEAFRAQQRYIESSQDMQDFNKEYNSETRKYFYDFATADKLATKVRKWRDAHQKGSPEYKQYEAILQDIYRTTDDAFNRLQQSNDNEPYEIIDNPYYIYNNIESQLDKELYNVNGTFMTIDDAARAWAARTRRDKKQYYTLSGDLRKIAKIRDEVKEIKKLFKEIGSDYYPGMPLNGRQQYIYSKIEQKTKALSSLYDEIALDNIQLIE